MKTWILRCLEDHGEPSTARVLSAICTGFALVWISYVVFKNAQLPDATATGGIAAFCTSHYLVNRGTTAFWKNTPANPPGEKP